MVYLSKTSKHIYSSVGTSFCWNKNSKHTTLHDHVETRGVHPCVSLVYTDIYIYIRADM